MQATEMNEQIGSDMNAAKPLMAVAGISKSYGTTMAVRELSFEIQPGEILGLLGPNGAGKTTAIRVLSTILPPSSGSFSVCGEPHTNPARIRQLIGVLPESAGYPTQQTGEEFLRFFARLYGHPNSVARELATTLFSEVGLTERMSRRIGTYSRGMRQRLGVARALVNEPKIIFLDEPTLGLDPAGQRQMLRLIKDVASERGTAVVLSTHFLDEVEEVCSRIIILNRGAIVAQGTVPEIKRLAPARDMRIRIAPERQDDALAVLERLDGVSEVSRNGERGLVTAKFDTGWLAKHSDAERNAAIQTLAAAEIPILSYELEGGKLSDAFLAVTQEESTP